jgi:hypothetical protein
MDYYQIGINGLPYDTFTSRIKEGCDLGWESVCLTMDSLLGAWLITYYRNRDSRDLAAAWQQNGDRIGHDWDVWHYEEGRDMQLPYEIVLPQIHNLAERTILITRYSAPRLRLHNCGMSQVANEVPKVEDREAAAKAAWEALNPEPDTIEWYNKFFAGCATTDEGHATDTPEWYFNALSLYKLYIADDSLSLDALRESYAELNECEGHCDSLNGADMGVTTYCDGSCRGGAR